jgi:hypothetical protein
LSAARKKISFSSLLPYWDSLRGDPRFEKSSPISRRRRQLPDNAAARIGFFPASIFEHRKPLTIYETRSMKDLAPTNQACIYTLVA